MILTKDGQILTKDGQILTSNGSGGASGKEVVEITTPLLVGDGLGENQTANLDNIELNNKYIIWNWYNVEVQGNLDYVQQIIEILLDFNTKQPKNSTIYMQIPYLDSLTTTTFVMELPNDFIVITDAQFIDDLFYIEFNRVYGDYFSCLFYGNKWNDIHFNISIKIDFDENGFATISFMHFYES